MKVDLSVIIVNFNTPKLVKECVKSVSTLGTESNFEIIAIDNASREPIGNRDLHLYDVSVIQNKINLGFAKAVNVGIKASRGKYILLLNSRRYGGLLSSIGWVSKGCWTNTHPVLKKLLRWRLLLVQHF